MFGPKVRAAFSRKPKTVDVTISGTLKLPTGKSDVSETAVNALLDEVVSAIDGCSFIVEELDASVDENGS